MGAAVAVTQDDPDRLRVLLLEDDDDFAVLLERFLLDNPEVAVEVDRAATLAEAVERAGEGGYDAALVDMNLPDSTGLRTVRHMVEQLAVVGGATATVVVSGMSDQHIASHALEIGAQDYLVKEELSPHLLVRIIRYAVTRMRLLSELEEARRGEERERELRRVERLASDTTTSVSSAMLGNQTLRESLDDRYEADVVDEYRRILELSLDEQAYRAGSVVKDDVRSLAGVLGYLGARPRDVIQLHSTVLQSYADGPPDSRSDAAVEEARLLVLQLMGELAQYYRARAVHRGVPRGDGGRSDG